jgi:hypothetical protein
MKAVGFWIRDALDNDFIHPSEVVGLMPQADAIAVAAHLRKGRVAEQYRGFSWCRCRCGISDQEMGSRDMTDGEWLWPEGLSHYVEAHRVALPDEFVTHARNPVVPKPSGEVDEVDLSAWVSWCRAHRNSGYIAVLEEARTHTELKTKTELELRAAELERAKGVGEDRCIWAGCINLALRGMRMCGLHSIRDEVRAYVRMKCSRIPDVPRTA